MNYDGLLRLCSDPHPSDTFGPICFVNVGHWDEAEAILLLCGVRKVHLRDEDSSADYFAGSDLVAWQTERNFRIWLWNLPGWEDT